MQIKIQSKINVGISMFSTAQLSSSSEPWHPDPPQATQSSIKQILLQSRGSTCGNWIITLLFITRNLLHFNPSPVGQDLTVFTHETQPNLAYIHWISSARIESHPTHIVMKRTDPSSPTRGDHDEDRTLKSPPKNRQYTGGRAMDEEKPAWPTPEEQKRAEEQLKEEKKRVEDAARTKRKEERAARIAEQKRTGVKVRKPKDGEWKEVNKEKTKGAGHKKSAAAEMKTPAAKTTKKGRGRSVDSAARKSSTTATRGTSVDSGLSRMSTESAAASEATQETSSSKRKKSAAFAAGIPENEGKTASTRKQQKAKDKESYAKKAAKEKKTVWGYSTIIKFQMRLGQCRSTCAEVYSRHKKMFTILQTYDASCTIQDHMNAKAPSLRSPGDFPSENEHGRYQRYFTLDGEQDWLWDNNITNSNPRNFIGSFILLSDKNPVEMFRYVRVDLRNQVQAVYEIKSIQELYTILSQVSLGVHANCDPDQVANDFREKLMKVETDIFERKKNWQETNLGFYEPIYDEIKDDWKTIEFPSVLGVRSYPKGGPYEKSKRGTDTSWKLAIHYEIARTRIGFSLRLGNLRD